MSFSTAAITKTQATLATDITISGPIYVNGFLFTDVFGFAGVVTVSSEDSSTVLFTFKTDLRMPIHFYAKDGIRVTASANGALKRITVWHSHQGQ